jgi:hypothetical protein
MRGATPKATIDVDFIDIQKKMAICLAASWSAWHSQWLGFVATQ